MFVSAAVKLTPEVYAHLKPFLDDLGLAPAHEQTIQDMLARRQFPNGPSISEIARTIDLSAQTVSRLDKEAHPAAQQAPYKSAFISYGVPDEAFARRL
jgi:hypothetical protein